MNEQLLTAKANFNLDTIKKDRAELYALRKQFVRKFTIDKIESMCIDEYIEGKGNTDSFCYWVERKLDRLGCIRGAFSTMFGLYYSADSKDYWVAKKYGNSASEALRSIKKEIVSLLEAGMSHDLAKIKENKLAPLFKGKILSLYYPETYSNVFSDDHLNHFLKLFNLDTEELMKQDAIYKREALIAFKNNDPEMKQWSNDIFGRFLYIYFHPKNAQNNVQDYATIKDYRYVNFDISVSEDKSHIKESKKTIRPKIDYEKESREFKRLGDRGEMVVMMAEKDRLKKMGLSSKQIDAKLIQVSKESDDYGYDIVSLNDDKTPRYIEVKATTRKPGDMSFYYTENECQTALKYGGKYYIYIVYDIKSSTPQIWRINNPLLSEKLRLLPVKYKVELTTK